MPSKIDYSSSISSVSPPSSPTSIPQAGESPKGLAGIPDSISPPPQKGEKPHFIKRTLISIGLVLVYLLASPFFLLHWIFEAVFYGGDNEKALYHKLSKAIQKGPEKIKKFLNKHKDKPGSIGIIFKEFLNLEEVHPHLPKILEGANVQLMNDGGYFYDKWSQISISYQRMSSHVYQEGKCRAIDHLLFWKALDGNTRFQLEHSPLEGFSIRSLWHLVKWMVYRRDNEQQGVTGISPHVEDHPIMVPIIPRSGA